MKNRSGFKTISQFLFVLFLLVGVGARIADARIMEYTDNEYNYTFKFPSDGKEKEVVELEGLGEVRILLQGRCQ